MPERVALHVLEDEVVGPEALQLPSHDRGQRSLQRDGTPTFRALRAGELVPLLNLVTCPVHMDYVPPVLVLPHVPPTERRGLAVPKPRCSEEPDEGGVPRVNRVGQDLDLLLIQAFRLTTAYRLAAGWYRRVREPGCTHSPAQTPERRCKLCRRPRETTVALVAGRVT